MTCEDAPLPGIWRSKPVELANKTIWIEFCGALSSVQLQTSIEAVPVPPDAEGVLDPPSEFITSTWNDQATAPPGLTVPEMVPLTVCESVGKQEEGEPDIEPCPETVPENWPPELARELSVG